MVKYSYQEEEPWQDPLVVVCLNKYERAAKQHGMAVRWAMRWDACLAVRTLGLMHRGAALMHRRAARTQPTPRQTKRYLEQHART